MARFYHPNCHFTPGAADDAADSLFSQSGRMDITLAAPWKAHLALSSRELRVVEELGPPRPAQNVADAAANPVPLQIPVVESPEELDVGQA